MITQRQPVYGIGDKVRIVKFGQLLYFTKEEYYDKEMTAPIIFEEREFVWIDVSPEYVGREGLVSRCSIIQGIPYYGIEFFDAGYRYPNTEDQMEMINRNPNR